MIEIYSKNNCSYCAHARDFLNINNMQYVEYKLDEDFTRNFVMKKFPTAKTYPIIVDNNVYIGGFIDLKNKYEIKNKTETVDVGAWNGA